MSIFARRASHTAAAYTTATKIQVGLNTGADHSEDADGQQRKRRAAPKRKRDITHAHDAAALRNREAEKRAVDELRTQCAAVVRDAPARPKRDAARDLCFVRRIDAKVVRVAAPFRDRDVGAIESRQRARILGNGSVWAVGAEAATRQRETRLGENPARAENVQ